MITYRTKSLKVKNIFARNAPNLYSDYIAKELKAFVERGEYSRIVEIMIYGQTNASLVCTVIYEEAARPRD